MEKFENTPGSTWIISPKDNPPLNPHASCHATGGVVAIISSDVKGVITIHLAYGRTECEYSAVVFDTEGKRYQLAKTLGGSSSGEGASAAMKLFGGHQDTNAPQYDKVAYWGIEVNKE